VPYTSRPRRARRTIGVLAGWQIYERTTTNWFLEALLRGVMDGARERGCDLLLACGIGDRIGDSSDLRPAWPVVGDDSHFVPIGGWNTDGIVVLSPLRTAARREHARRLQQAGHPLVFVGAGDGRPSVEIDSAAGIRQALEHLRAHGHSRVAFVAGDPLDCGDSALRLAAFRRVQPELGLHHVDDLVAHGYHSEQGGYEAMRAILARGCPFTAVVASNDLSAIGALRALAGAGREVPGDVAVVGFDDHLMASAHVPPLTSVRYPLAEAGRRAVELLVDGILEGRQAPDSVAIPPVLVGRRSCGCLPREPAFVVPGVPPAGSADATEPPVDAIAAEMAASALRAGAVASPAEAATTCGRLLAGLQESLRTGSAAAFERALIAFLQTLEAAGDRAHRWQSALSVLRQAVPSLLPPEAGPGAVAKAEDLLHFARVALSESAERQGARQRLVDTERADRVSALAVPLQSAQDEGEILDLLEAHAPALGLRPVCLAVYEPAAHDPVAWSRVLLLDGERPEPGSGSARLPTRGILPFRLRASVGPRCLAVLPLVHHDRALGFVALDVDTLEPCAAVARPLAVALETVRLQEAVRALTLTDDLTGLYNRRFFEQELRREAERGRRFGRSLALVMIDVDHFKSYNDRFGHRAGDDALRGVAACLVGAAARRVDAVTRYGGEEFAVLLAETEAEGARLVAERIREVVAESQEFLCPLTVSAGVTALRGDSAEAETLVLRADEALYRAKREGRNCVCVAG
jgi:diguanylate cyclase (GGDEF)-like protein